MRRLALVALVALLAAIAAHAEPRELCADRPGRATPPCIVDQGRLQLETGLADWSRDRNGADLTHSLAIASTEARYGVGPTTEIALTWAPFNTLTTRSGSIRTHSSGIGDVTLALRQSLANPDGKGISLAIQPFVTLPTAPADIGAGLVTAGILLPFAAELPADFALNTTAQLDWAADSDAHGHHFAWGGVVAVTHPLGPLQLGAELYAARDADPLDPATMASADLTLAWTPENRPDTQFDLGLNAGLTAATPDIELSFGIVRRF